MLRAEIWEITGFTVATAALATLLMLPPGLFFAWLLARGRFHGRLILDTAISLPLVMPPVATGLVLLAMMAPRGPVGRVLGRAGIEVVFTWKAVVLAMAVMGLPLFVRSVRAGIEQVDRRACGRELDLVPSGCAGVIGLDFRLVQGAFTLDITAQLDRPITALFGPSGAGKTTVLDAVAGLRTPASGSIRINDRVVFDRERGVNV